VIRPIAASGPCLTIRKFPVRRLTIGDLLRFGSLTPEVAAFLEAAVRSRRNIIVSGGTGTGKTSLLNCLSEFIPDHERIVTIEDTVELRLQKAHVVQLETKPANREGAGGYGIRDLVRNALRMRPDRVVVGECRGAEALDMLQAMNTGHDGSLTTIHANSAEDVTLRLEVMVQMAADLPVTSIHRQIATAVDLIVQAARLRDGRRVVSQVSEVVGVDPDTNRAVLRDLFHFEDDVEQLRPTGHLPTFMAELMARDLINLDAFYP
jgi:pilus assembly protein CpaF